ncbi:MAG: DUF4178 domain-containing protein [Elusimicrobia bacterium]|nr:DUF4178 domain-containing protein [Elusimicrobiota bacterium]
MNCPKCQGPLQFLHLPDGIDIESCPFCNGAFYDADELTFDLPFEDAKDAGCLCPRCGGAMRGATVYGGKLTLDHCGRCKGVWFDQGEMQKLRALSGKENVVGRRGPEPEAGAGPEPAGSEPAEPPPVVAAVPATREQILAAFNRKVGIKAKKDADGRKKPAAAEPFDCGLWDNPDIARNPCVVHDGRKYLHFQTSKPMTTYVLGEFNWRVAVGDEALARDFVCPPFILSEDKTEEDTTWSLGEHMEPQEVWQAFKMEGVPPYRTGTAPAQPNPHGPALDSMAPVFWKLAAAAAGIFALIAGFSQNKVIQTFPFQYAVTDPERSRVTFPFDIAGRTSNVRVKVDSNVDNQWAYFQMALIDTRTDEALDFGREVGYYHGVDGGESWSEGSRSDTAFLPSVKAGSYYLRVEPETDSQLLAYTIELKRDVPRVSYLLWAWLLLVLPVGWVWFRHRSFECGRWQESDHPWTTEDDDDDDDD